MLSSAVVSVATVLHTDPGEAHEFLQRFSPMFWFLTEQYHVGNPICHMVELANHAVNVFKAFTLLFLLGWGANMPYKIPWPNGGEHDPVDSCQLPGNIIIGSLHEYVPLKFG